MTTTPLGERALDTIRREGLLEGGERVLVAVSGGADSVALLDVLAELAPLLGLGLAVVHVHHGLRPEADTDADSVRRLCAAYRLPLHVERVALRRGPPWEGLEAEARRARYAALAARGGALGIQRIATGHTADDQAETVVMRLLTGAGPRGLAGIAPRRGPVIRPLLDAWREDVLAHLRERGLDWVEDATNRDVRFLRNRVRHDVLPFLGRVLGPSVAASLCRSAALTRRLVADLDTEAAEALERLARRGPAGVVLPLDALRRRPADVAVRILALAASELGVGTSGRAAAFRAMRRLVELDPPRRAMVTGGVGMERSGAWLRVGPAHLSPLGPACLSAPGCIALPEVGLRLTASRGARSPGYAPPRDPCRVAFDADRLPEVLTIRPPRAGDRFVPFGETRPRRLKSFLIDAGVPRWDRPRTPLVEAGDEILWVAGVRRGAGAVVGAETERILELTLDAPLAVLRTPG